MKQITTSDLRLCNWLYESKDSKFPMQVEGIGRDWIYLNFEGNEGDCFENTDKEIYPINITKELVKHITANIQDVEFGYMISIGNFPSIEVRIEYKDNQLYLIPTINCDECDIGEPIQYVHELQNLYYALTGKELEIKREWL